ncbi:hypothetical protein, partial [Alkalispirochaeta alkalica]|uniref:hypothetical protein n=1 Tax=Alkalispirochaeta alkalica TaxID=46356 RepID=UPI00058BC75A
MLKEILNYLEPGYYSRMSEEIETAVRDYAGVRSSGDEDQVERARERGRSVVESVLRAGNRSEESPPFVNLDAEFFTTDGALEEDQLRRFCREAVSRVCYQQQLWMLSGTRGSYTAVSERVMEGGGEGLSGELPAGRAGRRGRWDGPEVRQYLHFDGRIRPERDRRYQRVSFGVLRDQSGFSWDRGYDVNYQVKRSGERRFDEQGIWCELDDDGEAGEMREIAGSRDRLPQELVYLVELEEGLFLYDEEGLLCGGGARRYYREDGSVYGESERDIGETVRILGEEVRRRGGEQLAGVVIPERGDRVGVYREVLGDLAGAETEILRRSEGAARARRWREVQEQRSRAEALESVGAVSLALTGRGYEGAALIAAVEEVSRSGSVAVEGAFDEAGLEEYGAKAEVLRILEGEGLDLVREQASQLEGDDLRRYSRAVQGVVRRMSAGAVASGGVEAVIGAVSGAIRGESGEAGEAVYLDRRVTLGDLVLEEGGARGRREKGESIRAWVDRWGGDLPAGAIEQVVSKIGEIHVGADQEDALMGGLAAAFSRYREIARGSGLTPVELVSAVKGIVTGSETGREYAKRPVDLRQDVREVVAEAVEEPGFSVRLSYQELEAQGRRDQAAQPAGETARGVSAITTATPEGAGGARRELLWAFLGYDEEVQERLGRESLGAEVSGLAAVGL